MQQLPSQTAVLIAGAGPTGLALAGELRRRSIPAMIVDRLAEGENTSRAAVVHAHTLEVLQPLDVSPTLIAEGVKVPIFRVRDRDTTLLSLNFTQIPSVYAYTLIQLLQAIAWLQIAAEHGDAAAQKRLAAELPALTPGQSKAADKLKQHLAHAQQ